MTLDMAAGLLREAERFETAARKLREAAEVLSGNSSNGAAGVGQATGSRLEQLQEFLKKNGPLSRKEIRKRSGIPHGTLGSLLKEANFTKDDDGLWSNK